MWVLLFLASAVAAPLTAADAVEQALGRSVDVAEAQAALMAAEGRARAAGFLRLDPQLQGSWAAVGESLELSVSQPISLTGEGLAARRSARREVEAAEQRLRRERLEVAADVRRAWVAAVEAQQRRVLASEAVELAGRLREGAERRLETGEASLLDARLARLEETEALATWMAAMSGETTALAALAALAGVQIEELELPEDPLDGAPVYEEGAAERSDLLAARLDVDAARAAVARERAGVLPPVGVGAFYEEEGDETRIGPSVSLMVPLWQRNAAGRAAARAELYAADARLDMLERSATSEQQATERAIAQMASAAGRMDVDAPAEARAALESVALGYAAGELDLLSAALLRTEILAGQRAWLEGRRALALARIAYLLAHEHPALIEDQ